jgi:hypothetical protein
VGPVAQSVWRLCTGWKVRGWNPGGGEIFRACPDRPWSPPSLLYNGFFLKIFNKIYLQYINTLTSVLDSTKIVLGQPITCRTLAVRGGHGATWSGYGRYSSEKMAQKKKHCSTMGTGSFTGEESGPGVTLTHHPLLVPNSKNRVWLYLYSP